MSESCFEGFSVVLSILKPVYIVLLKGFFVMLKCNILKTAACNSIAPFYQRQAEGTFGTVVDI